MFQGETAITIDDKGRLAVPTAYRELVARECANSLVITYNPFESGSLWLYPRVVWERVRDQVNALPKAKKVNRSMQLKLVGAAEFVELDGNGRFGIPASHRAAVGIEKKAVLLGMGEKFELWAILLGAICGARHSTPALRAAQEETGSAIPAVGYPVAYAVSSVLVLVLGYLALFL